MRVPVYDNLQTGIATTNGAQLRNQDVGAIGEIGARQAAQMGQVLSNAGDALGQVVLQRQAQVNEAAAKQVDIETDRQVREVLKGQNGYLNQQGGNAIATFETTRKQIAEIYAHAGDALSNDDARQMWNGVAAQREATAMDMVDTHHGQQQQKYVIDTTEARIRHESEGLADSLNDPKAYDVHMGIILTEAAHMSALLGETDPALIEQRKQAYLAAAHAGVINHLMASNQPTVAEQYLTAHAEQMGKNAVDQLKPQVHEAASASLAITNATAAIAELGMDKPGATFDVEALRKWGEKTYGNDARGLAHFRQEIDDRYAAHINAENAREKANVDGFYQVLTDKGATAAKASVYYTALGGVARKKIDLQLEEERNVRVQLNQYQSDRARALQRQHLAVAAGELTVEEAANMGASQRRAIFGADPEIEAFVANKGNARSSGAPALIAPVALFRVLRSVGLKPDSQKQEDRTQVAYARFIIEDALRRDVERNGPLTDARLNSVVQGVLRQAVDIDQEIFALRIGNKRVTGLDMPARHVSVLNAKLSDFSLEERKFAAAEMSKNYEKNGEDPRYRSTPENLLAYIIGLRQLKAGGKNSKISTIKGHR